jgi:ABC-type transporter Mla maintaining outer membrane lipid asymmetry ATPase subunit MlaF
MSETQTSVAAIEMRDVSFARLSDPGMIVAEGVNWRVEQGDFWVVAGLHGSGKSDLLMLVGGVMAPSAGSYEFLGEGMPIFSDERLAHRLKLGLVFDGGRLFNHLTIAENIALPLRYHRNLSSEEAGPTVGALVELTGLTPHAHRHPGELGRNLQRRAALARALALRPELLLLDTPLTGLDSRQHNWWLGLLGELSRGHAYYSGQPITIIVTAAGLRDWHGHARQFALLEGGKLAVLGDWTSLERSSDPLVKELLGNASNI